MEGIIFTGIQASGKSSFYKEKLFQTHIRLNMDMLKTRHREDILLSACIEAKQPVVMDNTNISRRIRSGYIDAFRKHHFQVIGYFFDADPRECLERNNRRKGSEKIPPAGIFGTFKKLEVPSFSEGFDALYRVVLREDGFLVEEWMRHE